MLSFSDIQLIEDEAVSQYVSQGLSKTFDDEIVDGDVPKWSDVDRYYMVPASCTVPGNIISDWAYGDFWSIVDKYLRSQDAKNFYDLATPSDIENTESYMDFCLEQCQNAEDMFWDYDYDKKCLEYLLDHANFD